MAEFRTSRCAWCGHPYAAHSFGLGGGRCDVSDCHCDFYLRSELPQVKSDATEGGSVASDGPGAIRPSPGPSPQTDDGAVPVTPPQGPAHPPEPAAPSSLTDALDELEATDPAVAKTAADYDAMHDHILARSPWDERPAMDPEDATHAMRVIQNDPDPQRRAFALGAMSTIIATCAVFPGVKSDRMLAETLRTLRDRVPWGADEPDQGEDHR